MIKFVSFKLSDADSINEFLDKNSGVISKDGVTISGDQISILYSGSTPEELERQNTLGAMKEFIGTRMGELLGSIVDEAYERGLVAKGEKRGARVVEAASRKINLAAQIKFAKSMIKSIEDGTWLKALNDQGASIELTDLVGGEKEDVKEA